MIKQSILTKVLIEIIKNKVRENKEKKNKINNKRIQQKFNIDIVIDNINICTSAL